MGVLLEIDPVTLLLVPPALVLLAAISLAQFGMVFRAFSSFAKARHGMLGAVQPVLRNVALHLESTLGNADKFQPGLTHVLLMAILLAVVLSMKSLSRAVVNAISKRD
mmetsp:Transcript_9830/g.34937  ORF Transcript_9830/g.34937 Transcript_9830/m.34937 type:complete len:108 (-) Transcript_9830:116-439(-)